MTLHKPLTGPANMPGGYTDSIALIERLHRLLLDVVKDEFERLELFEINPVQALLLYNIGHHEVTAGELKSRGYYQGSNVSYNLKRLVESGHMHHRRSDIDRRSVRVRLTAKGIHVHQVLRALFERQAGGLDEQRICTPDELLTLTTALRRIERYWGEQIRYIY